MTFWERAGHEPENKWLNFGVDPRFFSIEIVFLHLDNSQTIYRKIETYIYLSYIFSNYELIFIIIRLIGRKFHFMFIIKSLPFPKLERLWGGYYIPLFGARKYVSSFPTHQVAILILIYPLIH